MKIITLTLSFVSVLALGSIAAAAPVESVPASTATSAHQTIDAYLSQDIVVDALESLGLNRAAIDARLAQLTDSELRALAAEIELVQAGGQIQKGSVYADNPIASILRPLGRLFHNIYQLIFGWGRLN